MKYNHKENNLKSSIMKPLENIQSIWHSSMLFKTYVCPNLAKLTSKMSVNIPKITRKKPYIEHPNIIVVSNFKHDTSIFVLWPRGQMNFDWLVPALVCFKPIYTKENCYKKAKKKSKLYQDKG